MRARQGFIESRRSQIGRQPSSGRGGTSRDRETIMYNTVKIVNMEENIVLSSARKAVTARLAALGRRFSADDINEMVSLTVERFYTKGHYDSDKSSIKTYVSQIAFRVVYDFVKSADKNSVRYIRLDDVKDSESSESYMDFTERDLRFADPKGADYDILRKRI